MERQRLIIVCGVPGAGKSTLALHVADRWGAVSLAHRVVWRQRGNIAFGAKRTLRRIYKYTD